MGKRRVDGWKIFDKQPILAFDSTWDCLVVCDKHTELRKLQIDKPDTKFEIQRYDGKWIEDIAPSWCITSEYRVKPKEWYEDPDMIGNPVWVRDGEEDVWRASTFKGYEEDNDYPFFAGSTGWRWRYAKPVKHEDLYQGDKDE